jgi:hypothetical protein
MYKFNIQWTPEARELSLRDPETGHLHRLHLDRAQLSLLQIAIGDILDEWPQSQSRSEGSSGDNGSVEQDSGDV